MKKNVKKSFIMISIIISMLILACFGNMVKAAEPVRGLVDTKYRFNGHTIHKFAINNYSNTDLSNVFCLRARANMNSSMSVEDNARDIYNLTDAEVKYIFLTPERYKSFLWLIDNSYISLTTYAQPEDMKANLSRILKEHKNAETSNEYIDTALNEVTSDSTLMYALQQAVIWHYTNNNNLTNAIDANSFRTSSGAVSSNANYIFNALIGISEGKSNYQSPNKVNSQNNPGNGRIQNYLNNLHLSNSNVSINYDTETVGPFVLENYDENIRINKNFTVKIDNSVIEPSKYVLTMNGNQINIKFTNIDFKDTQKYSVNIEIGIQSIETFGKVLISEDVTTGRTQPLILIDKATWSIPIGTTYEKEKAAEFDLHLSKNIVNVYSKNIDGEYVAKSEQNMRNLSVITTSLKYGSKDAVYLSNKYPISVSKGDIIKYAITIHNEGDIDGYATEITDYLAPGLRIADAEEIADIGETVDYGWTTTGTTTPNNAIQIVKTTYLNNKLITKFENEQLDSEVIYIYCKVVNENTDELLKNVAEITADRAEGEDEPDRDSNPASIEVNVEAIKEWEGYSIGNADSVWNLDPRGMYSILGWEDDDDFENVVLENFDLALIKTITEIDLDGGVTSQSVNRFEGVGGLNTLANSQNVTTARYYMQKNSISVKQNSLITYKIQVFNEGNISGYANEITDYLPAGLVLAENSDINTEYGWVSEINSDGTTTIKTDYLSKDKSVDNIINAFDRKSNNLSLDSKYVEVQCKIGSEVLPGTVLTNVAEISDYGYYKQDGTYVQANSEGIDRDSINNNLFDEVDLDEGEVTPFAIISAYEEKFEMYQDVLEKAGKVLDEEYLYRKEESDFEDDDDFESVTVEAATFDLALRKSIVAVNGESVHNEIDLVDTRVPKITIAMQIQAMNNGTASYKHDKEFVQVEKNDEITYSLRVFNEGTSGDYAGYATEITDYLPEGLEFVSLAEGYDDEFKATTETVDGIQKLKLEYIGEKILPVNTFLKIDIEEALPAPETEKYFQEVSIICKATSNEDEKILTNRAEITGEQAVTGNEVDGYENIDVSDRDSIVGSLNFEELNLDNYYNDYAYGINDAYIEYYKGIEGTGEIVTRALLQDDIDFENIKVRVPQGKYDLRVKKIDNSNNTELEGVSFKVNEDTEEYKTAEDGIVILADQVEITETENKDVYTIKEVSLGEENNSYAMLKEPITLYVTKALEDRKYYVSGVSFEENEIVNEKVVKLENDMEVTTEVKLEENVITLIVPNDKMRFDLALKKFITSVQSGEDVTEYNEREPQVDPTPLKEGELDAEYEKPEDAVGVNQYDLVTYTIRVYNEGIIDAKVKEVMDDIPEGLQYYSSKVGDIDYKWTLYRELKDSDKVNEEEIVEYDKVKYVKTTSIEEATMIRTDYAAETILKAYKPSVVLDENNHPVFDEDNEEVMEWPEELDYVDVKVIFKVIAPNSTSGEIINTAEITKHSDRDDDTTITDRDSTPNNKIITEDDIDTEKIKLINFDFALRKFITATQKNASASEEAVNNRIPEVDTTVLDNGTGTTAKYTHTKDPKEVYTGSIITYTIRVYNEGTTDGYATEVMDDLPEGITFLPQNATNVEYRWKMYIEVKDENGNVTSLVETDDASKATIITTDYLSKAVGESAGRNNLMKAYDVSKGMTEENYRDLKVAFIVDTPNNKEEWDRVIINTAEVTKHSDKDGKTTVKDRDSIPNNRVLTEDDIDKEYIKVLPFDLSLLKWVSTVEVYENGQKTTTTTGHTEATALNEDPVLVSIQGAKINSVTVKFIYDIKVENEGKIPGYAKEIKDHIPDGLKFVQSDNPTWTVVDDKTITTDSLKDTLLKPGEKAYVRVVLTWINGEENFNLKVNHAEISKDYNEWDTPDIDSTPNNWTGRRVEDDEDDAPVLLTVRTGEVTGYVVVATLVTVVFAAGVFGIKKFIV